MDAQSLLFINMSLPDVRRPFFHLISLIFIYFICCERARSPTGSRSFDFAVPYAKREQTMARVKGTKHNA